MRKYGENTQANVYTGLQAGVINTYMKRFGKAIGNFTDDEKSQLENELEAARQQENAINGVEDPVEPEEEAPKPAAKKPPVKKKVG